MTRKGGEVGMTVKEAILTLNANAVIACERAGFSSATVKMIEDALDTIEDALKVQEPRLITDTELEEIRKVPLILKPNVDAVPVVHGRWIDYKYDHQCSACKEHITFDAYAWIAIQFEFCPYCGAKMDGERRESE